MGEDPSRFGRMSGMQTARDVGLRGPTCVARPARPDLNTPSFRVSLAFQVVVVLKVCFGDFAVFLHQEFDL
ncbi:MAG: hypothetical protein ACI8Z1_004087, partial [Candidatus Azotimanducaceae bacterium]